jgi:hypothetical protein
MKAKVHCFEFSVDIASLFTDAKRFKITAPVMQMISQLSWMLPTG